MDPLQDAREALKTLKIADNDRYEFVERMLERMSDMSSENAKLVEQLKESEYTRANLWRDLESSQHDVAVLRTSMGRNAFVLVLVDGDAMPFRNDFLRQGTSGGEAAARALRKAVIHYVEENASIAPGFEVLIRVYSKMEFLDIYYRDNDMMEKGQTLYEFVQGFNRVHRLCEYVDAGNDKEGADSKVQTNMELFINNVQCKHIILCASSDNSYTGFLRQFVGTSSERITLVEGISFPEHLAEVAPKFGTTKFSSIFRDSKLSKRASRITGVNGQAFHLQTTSYASTVSGQNVVTEAIAPASADPVSPTRINGGVDKGGVQQIQINKDDQRVDPRLPSYIKHIVPTLKGKKLCNRYYLTYCPGCNYDHKTKLNPSELETLRWIARLSPCGNGTGCRDTNCVTSHMCVYGANCTDPTKCRYPEGMHHLDSKPAKSVEA